MRGTRFAAHEYLSSPKNYFRHLSISRKPNVVPAGGKKMQYLALIYEDETRFAKGFPESEFAEYGAFGKKNAPPSRAETRLQPTGTAKTVRVRDDQGPHHRWSFRGNERAAWRLLSDRSADHREGGLDRSWHPGCPLTAASKSGPSWSFHSSLATPDRPPALS